MDLETYLEETRVTWNEELSKPEQFLNMEWGVIGETGEVLELIKKDRFHPHRTIPGQKYLEECGDVLYYCTTYMRLTSRPFEVPTDCFLELDTQGNALKVGLKEYLTTGHPQSIVYAVQGILWFHGYTVQDARQANIEKLRAKYPSGFPKGNS